MDKSYLTAKEIAEFFDVSVRTVWRWNASGQFPKPFHRGRVTRWKRQDIEALHQESGVRSQESGIAPTVLA